LKFKFVFIFNKSVFRTFRKNKDFILTTWWLLKMYLISVYTLEYYLWSVTYPVRWVRFWVNCRTSYFVLKYQKVIHFH